MKGATSIAKSLAELGAECVFGYTGAAILAVADELGKGPIRIVVNANEQCAASSAAGYSRSTDMGGVAIVTSGPAITKTLTAVADSYADGMPLLIKRLLLNSPCDGRVRNPEDVACGGRHSATERPNDIDLAAMAKVCHFPFAARVKQRDDVRGMMESWLAVQVPAMLEVLKAIEETIYPVVRPGSSYAEMQLGPYIRERTNATQ